MNCDSFGGFSIRPIVTGVSGMRAYFLSYLVVVTLGFASFGCDEADNGVDQCLSDEQCPGGERCIEGFCAPEELLERDDDGDGILNGEEVAIGTDPRRADSDGDGIEDGDEVAGQLDDPPDADGDGIIDALDSASVDDDGDGVPNQQDPCNLDPTCPEKPDESCNGEDDDFDGEIDEDWNAENVPEGNLPLGAECFRGRGTCRGAGVVVCALDQTDTTCSATPGVPGDEICNFDDDDCDGNVDEGYTEQAANGCEPASPDVCDGINNDYDRDTVDGSAHDWFGAPCDGDGDADLCAEGVWDCVGGEQTCIEESGDEVELCDGVDNDCDPRTPDGAHEAWLGIDCDGADSDRCPEGSFVCTDGVRTCDDITGDLRDVCDGEDNDCNDETPDGADEPWFGAECDSEGDTDLCPEGRLTCDGAGGRVCDEPRDDAQELCDRRDNDCDPRTADGAHEGWLGGECDGDDADECADGAWVCTDGGQLCTDDADSHAELCDGVDNDCDGTTDEGYGAGDACSAGVGACGRDGAVRCAPDGLTAACDAQPGAPAEELCGSGVDEDCDGETDEGFDQVGEACAVGVGACERAGVWVCDGAGVRCDAQPGAAAEELCGTGVDEDCDGSADEGFEAEGAPCNVGVGACNNDGQMACSDDRLELACDAQPGAPAAELCGDAVDNDCDATTDEGFDDGDACVVGVGACEARGQRVCDEDGGGTHCDAVPGAAAPERCGNGVDDDCDGEVDEGFDVGDACGVGVGACAAQGVRVCTADGAGTECGAAPGQPVAEVCGNGVDDDCNGAVDDGFPTLGDACSVGVGACGRDGQLVCNAGGDGVVCGAQPGAPAQEVCDGDVDNDCDGAVDEGFNVGNACSAGAGACRADGVIVCDGAGGATCDAQPGQPVAELCGDGVDNDCDGQVDDGFDVGDACAVGVGECLARGQRVCAQDGVGTVCDTGPGQPGNELCGNNLDDDCDGEVDEGFDVGLDCSVGVGACAAAGAMECAANGVGTVCGAVPGQPVAEVCGDGVDNDCNGNVDDGFPTLGDACSVGAGACGRDGQLVCNAGGDGVVCDAQPGQPAQEVCDGDVDNDCDGATDEGFNVGGACSVGEGACRADGAVVCDDAGGARCDAVPGQPAAELCGDGVDNDCDGEVDDGFPQLGQVCSAGVGACVAQGVVVCAADQLGTACDAVPGAPGAELCDGVDNDCDGDPEDDGADEPTLGDPCDGEDADGCAEGNIICLGGGLACSDLSGEAVEVCDGEDNDCDEQADEGFGVGDACSAGVGACLRDGVVACDPESGGTLCTAAGGQPIGELCGDDEDNDCDGRVDEGFPTLGDPCVAGIGACERPGVMVCAANGGSAVCDAVPGQPAPDVCDGVDNDCNPETPDGSADDRVGVDCDGPDSDDCLEGRTVCRGGAVVCTDDSGDDVEVCDGADNDCDNAVDESFAALGDACQAGVGQCRADGVQVCNANGDGTACNAQPGQPGAELCDGVDNDCDGDPEDDGADEPTLGDRCDGRDADDCLEGDVVCGDGGLTCTDRTGDDVEVCDGEDNDCDNSVDETFVDLGDACSVGVGECQRDGARVCDQAGAGTTCSAVPGQPGPERCDGLDNDCDADPEDDGADEPTLGDRCDGPDADRCDEGAVVCVQGGLSCTDESDDNLEVCDGADNDCDLTTDEGFAGLGDACAAGVGECAASGRVVCTADAAGVECDAVPGAPAPEVCDGLDNDCDGDPNDDGADDDRVDVACDGPDADRCMEGAQVCADGAIVCDDATPDSVEVCDGEDNDCDLATDEGYAVGAACSAGVGACQQDGVEVCTADGLGTQCNAAGGQPIGELCGDNEDNDCDGRVDEGFPTLGDACAAGVGECRRGGVMVCSADRASAVCDAVPGAPGAELCDGLDNDCDADPNDDGSDEEGIGAACDGADAGRCQEGNVVCVDARIFCDDFTGDDIEVCDGVDNNCDNRVDEPFEDLGFPCQVGVGACSAAGTTVCAAGGQATVCDAVPGQPGPELCNGVDDDCDGDPSDDGADELTFGDPCDGPDAGGCMEGRVVCVEAALGCDDFTGDDIEVCDNEDNDCDNAVDELFPTLGDACAAGVGECRVAGRVACTADGQGAACDAVPGQPGRELCDGLDNDCDGDPNDDGAGEVWAGQACDGADADACDEGVEACQGAQRVCTDTSDDDVEVCDGEDNDCDGAIDEGFVDLGDACNVGVGACRRAGRMVCAAGGQATVCDAVPGQPGPELCDGVDNDCDGDPEDDGAAEDWFGVACDGADLDRCREGVDICQDGARVCTDNSDDDVEVCDGVDNDCDLVADEDFSDLGDPCSAGVGECRRGGNRVCRADGAATECNAAPGQPAPEVCDGLDNDCDADPNDDGADEDWFGADCDGPDLGACLEGVEQCRAGGRVCSDNTADDVEVCDGADNDCDQATDEGFVGLGDACANGIGECSRPGTVVCSAAGDGVLCDAVPGLPGAEACDGLDNDCDGDPEDDGADDQRVGVRCDGGDADACLEGVQFCGGGDIVCSDQTGDTPEVCDGVDNDCDRAIDEGFVGLGDACANGTGECSRAGQMVCNPVGDGVLCDAVPGSPGREICDGLDNDCDGDPEDDGADERWLGGACDGADADGCDEGIDVCQLGQRVCTDNTGDNVEICDGVDNDCDQNTDEDFAAQGLGDDCSAGVGECRAGGQVVCTADHSGVECDAVPGQPARELCDGLDNDCDGDPEDDGTGELDFGQPCDGGDADGCDEGVNVCEGGEYFCNDFSNNNADPCGGGDQDCDNVVDEDFQSVDCNSGLSGPCAGGATACTAGAVECVPNVQPGERPDTCNGQDDDCDPQTPDGADDATFGDACDGADADRCDEGTVACVFSLRQGGWLLQCNDPNDANPELCNGIDDDCNGQTPDGQDDPRLGNECDGDDADACFGGLTVCQGGGVVCDDPGNIVESCNLEDDDCDNIVDEGNPESGQVCNTDLPGICATGTTECTANGLGCRPDNQPRPDNNCNGEDDDCDNETDESFQGAACNTGLGGRCEPGVQVCVGAGVQCQALNPEAEVCDGLDNDCDGVVDNGLCCRGNDDLRFAATTRATSGHPLQTAGDVNGSWGVLHQFQNGNVTELAMVKRDTGIVHPVHNGFRFRTNAIAGVGAATGLAYTTAEDLDSGELQPVYVSAYVLEIGIIAAQRTVHLRGMAGERNVGWTAANEVAATAGASDSPAIASDSDGLVVLVWRDGNTGALMLGEFRVTYQNFGQEGDSVGFQLMRQRRIDSGGVNPRSPRVALIPAAQAAPAIGVVWVEGEVNAPTLRFRSIDRNTFAPDMAVRVISGPGVNGNNQFCDAPDIAHARDGGGHHFAITCAGADVQGAHQIWYAAIQRGGAGLRFIQVTGGGLAAASGFSRVGYMRANAATYVVYADGGQVPGQYVMRIEDRGLAGAQRIDPNRVPQWPAVHIFGATLYIPHHRTGRITEGWIYELGCQ